MRPFLIPRTADTATVNIALTQQWIAFRDKYCMILEFSPYFEDLSRWRICMQTQSFSVDLWARTPRPSKQVSCRAALPVTVLWDEIKESESRYFQVKLMLWIDMALYILHELIECYTLQQHHLTCKTSPCCSPVDTGYYWRRQLVIA